jgi:hypothetical protein
MRTKSKYRKQYRDGGRVDQLASEQPPEAVSAAPEAPAPAESPTPPQAKQPPQDDDSATLALKRQIESLRQSEHIQRQQAAMPQEPMTREARLAEWQAKGLSHEEVRFFQDHPAMIDHPEITNFAVHRAFEAGHPRGSAGHFDFVKKSFDAHVEHLMQQQAPPAMQPTTPTPKFFAPPPGRSAPNPSAIVSAPVSREVPNSTGKRSTPGKVVLTPSEVEAARISGLTVEAYAKQKIEYERQRETGEYRDNREQR